MSHTYTTLFPSDIDPREYFSDISLQHTDILDGYNELVADGQYQQASQYLSDNGYDIDYNGAYLWNRFDNRILSIETYALDMPETQARNIYSNTEPTGQPKGKVWVSS